ncbi:type IV toxin-antitoxin system AbiEi family antitoxin domain-containing protein, partial [Streptomyces sp. NPDC005125]
AVARVFTSFVTHRHWTPSCHVRRPSLGLIHLADADLLDRAARSVYQVPGATPAAHLDIKVAWLRLDPAVPAWERRIGDDRSGVVSHASACQLHIVGDIPADDVELSVPRRRTTREPGVSFHRTVVPTQDITVIDGLPVTTMDRTICDLLRARADAGHVGRVIADADQRGLIDTRTLAPRVQPYARFYGMPRTIEGTDLLESLADQAGFTLRDQRITAAGERAALASALNPELALAALLRTDRSHLDTSAPSSDPTTLLEHLRRIPAVQQSADAAAAASLARLQERLGGTAPWQRSPNLEELAASVAGLSRHEQLLANLLRAHTAADTPAMLSNAALLRAVLDARSSSGTAAQAARLRAAVTALAALRDHDEPVTPADDASSPGDEGSTRSVSDENDG